MTPVASEPRSRAHPAKFDPHRVRTHFPILTPPADRRALVYLDNAATTQKPLAVIEAIGRYYRQQNSNIHRGVYRLSQEATAAYESARAKVAAFVNATSPAECIFTRGTTESINLVAGSWGRTNLKAGDEIIVTAMEHHSDIVPWQLVCQATGALLRVIPMNDAGELLMDDYRALLASGRVKMVAAVQVSNSLGTINDVRTITTLAHDAGAKVLIDGAQWVAHGPTDVRKIGCDFYAFSGHKLYGPTGIGVLWGRGDLLETMPPFMGGGDMIERVTFEKTTYARIPSRFEAGTPHIAGAIGLGAAIDYLTALNWSFVEHEHDLQEYATRRLGEIPGLRLIGTARNKASVVSFVMDDPPIATLDLGIALDARGIAVRTGHHCCQPVMDRLGIPGTARASLALYNTREDVDALADALGEIQKAAKATGNRAKGSAGTEAVFPEAVADTPAAAGDELVETFTLLRESGMDPRNYVLDLADKLPPLPEILKNGRTFVPGCMSQVWLVARPRPGRADRMEFAAESDAQIVKGLIAILQRVFCGMKPADILGYDVQAMLGRLGFEQLITVQRRSGVEAMIGRIREHAKQLAHSARGES